MVHKAVNWNRIDDDIDKQVWDKLVSQFWVPERIAISNDLPSWKSLSPEEREVTMRVFAGLTLLDTVQATVGAIALMPDAQSQHEEAIYTNVAFMEAIHAKSYSSIFSTLASMKEIDDIFRWAEQNELLQNKADIVRRYYDGHDPLKKKVASTLLESFLFYSGFYWPLYLSSRAKLSNTADVIRLIVRDECHTDDHELLTPTGWKNVSLITTEDLVAQYDDTLGTVEFVHPVHTSSHMAERTWEFATEQGHVRQSVSPNHRMFLERREYGVGTEYSAEVTKADDLKQSRLNGYARFVNSGYGIGPRTALSPEERLLIAVQADGSYAGSSSRQNGEKTGGVSVSFSFSKERKIERITMLAAQAGWRFTERQPSRAHGRVKEKRNFNLLVPLEYVSREKQLSDITDLSDVSALWCQEFIDELANWDGHRVPESGRITWGCVDKRNVDYVQAVASLAGYRTHYGVRVDDRSETFSDYHRLQINTDSRHTGAQRVVKTEGPARMVYGVEVPSSYLLTRNNGSVTITGNSVHGYYIGSRFQKQLAQETPERQKEMEQFTYDLLEELYENELKYTADIYDGLGLTADVTAFLHYNANKALNNLGYDSLFPSELCQFNPGVRGSLSLESEVFDFFSGSGSSYIIGKSEETDDEDWSF